MFWSPVNWLISTVTPVPGLFSEILDSRGVSSRWKSLCGNRKVKVWGPPHSHLSDPSLLSSFLYSTVLVLRGFDPNFRSSFWGYLFLPSHFFFCPYGPWPVFIFLSSYEKKGVFFRQCFRLDVYMLVILWVLLLCTPVRTTEYGP